MNSKPASRLPHVRPVPWRCRIRHARRGRWEYRFNGGNGAWLCPRCRTILKYGHERY